jgi:glutamate synthase domain-containing protein 3
VESSLIVLDCAELTTREINQRLRSTSAGGEVSIVNPRGRHNLAVGLMHRLKIRFEGDVGHYIGGLCDGPDIEIDGFCGWGVGENLMSGTIRIRGNASERAGASAHGGTIVIDGDASTRAGISLKGGTVIIGGDVGDFSAFMAQAGTILVGGNAGEALGDSLYESVVYVSGKVKSFGSDARPEDLSDSDVAHVRALSALAGFTHIDPENVTRVASAKELYHFDAAKAHRY